MKKSMVTRTSGKWWMMAGGLMLALGLGNMKPAAAQDDATRAAIITLRMTVPARIVGFAAGAAKNKLKIGGGQCTDLVIAALASAGAKPGDFSNQKNYVWGTLKKNYIYGKLTAAMGDIIQFEGCYFESPDKASFTMEHHTAIVESNNRGVLAILHQNGPGGGEARRDTLNIGWLKRGTFKIYTPIPQ